MQPVIETHNLSKIYQGPNNLTVKAVENANITINAGEFVALVGPSGSGKTTMLAMLAALLEPTEGNICIDGQEIGRLKDSQRVKFRREKIGFTFQSNNLVPYLTVLENVEMMLRLNNRHDRAGREEALDLLERLGLCERLNSLPSQLSGGQRQRVAIARSMIHGPSVILADEPTASLDTERAYQVTQLYADLIHENGKAGIMVTHDLRMFKYVDKIIQIGDGHITSILDNREDINELISCA
jgi:putative ABC transport system ATP-binding protein